MAKRKGSKTQNELDTLKKELLHEFRLFHIRVSEELKKLSKALSELENTLDRCHQEFRLRMRNGSDKVIHAINIIQSGFDASRE
jgi:hypothetical protein